MRVFCFYYLNIIMGILNNPTNTNLLQASKFVLNFDRLPHMAYFCTGINLPGVTTNHATQVNPFIDLPVPGDKMVYDNLNIEFLLDEELNGWEEIVKWIKGYSFPENFGQYKDLSMQQRIQMGNTDKPQYSDGSLIVYSNKNNPILQVNYKDLFPIAVSDVKFSTSQDATIVSNATATFKFANYSIVRV